MKKDYLIPIFIAILIGFISANYIYKEYKNTTTNNKDIYFIQISASNTLNDNTNTKNTLTLKEDDKYYTYIGMTSNKDIANKIKEIYKKDNIDLYIKKKNIDNINFITELEQYDILLKGTDTKEEIDNILKSILSSFEENTNNL